MKELEAADFGLPSPKRPPRPLNVPELGKPTNRAALSKAARADRVATWTPVIVNPGVHAKDKNQFVPANQR